MKSQGSGGPSTKTTPGHAVPVGRAAAPHVIGYLVAAGMIGGAVLPAGIGLALQSTGVSSLGICLSALAAVFGGIHVAARGR